MESRRHRQKVTFMNKENAELKSLADKGLIMSGNALSSVLLLKGDLSQLDLNEGLLSGKDGDALHAALNSLQYEPQDWMAIATKNRQNQDVEPELLRQAVSVAGAKTIIICDNEACEVFRNAYAEELAALPDMLEAVLEQGRLVKILGMRVLNLGGFEASLTDEIQKRYMWRYLKQVPRLREPY